MKSRAPTARTCEEFAKNPRSAEVGAFPAATIMLPV